MSELIDEIEIDCPYCNKEITISIKKVDQSVTCPFCQQSFDVEDDGLLDALDDVDNQIDDFLNNLSF